MIRRLLLAAIFAGGCATVGPRLTASVDDYDDYRRFRNSATVEDRLRLGHAYLSRHPDGEWRAEVGSWFRKEEPRYFESARNDRAKLRRYLDALPRGPHAEEAAERVVALDLALDSKRRRERVLVAFARDIEEDLDLAARRRRKLVRALSLWAAQVASIRTWGERTSALHHEFIFEWRITDPPARCVGTRCTKAMSFPYSIPDDKRLTPRLALLDVSLHLRDGGVERAIIFGPELFSRLGEALQLGPVEPGDAQRRAEAIARAVQLVAAAVEPHLPVERCAKPAISPVVLARECAGVRLHVVAAADPAEEDRIEVVPVVVTPRHDDRDAGDGGTENPVRGDSGSDSDPR